MNDQKQEQIIEETVSVLSETFAPASSIDESASGTRRLNWHRPSSN